MGRPPIALFTEHLDFDDSYSDLLWRAVDSRADERGHNLVVCVGHRLDDEDPELRSHNPLYHLVLDRPLSALILSHIVYQHLPAPRLSSWAGRLAGLPVAATTAPLGTVPLVLMRSEEGMRALVRHLIVDHQKRRILFVTGTAGVSATSARRRIWAEEMAAAHLPFGDEWVVEGHFNPQHCPGVSQEVAQRARALGADAVVTSGDLIAAVLVKELPLLGFAVPGALAVTGFDDLPLAALTDPPLTTVRQPVWDQYRAAVDQALDPLSPGVVCEGRLVTRESCGCVAQGNPDGSPGLWRRRLAESRAVTHTLRGQVAELNLFAGQMGLLEGAGGLGPLYDEWLPRLGIGDFFLSLACDAEGVPRPVDVGDDPFTVPGPVWHRRWARRRGEGDDGPLVFEARDLAPDSWWDRPGRRTTVALPLARSGRWFGLLVVELASEGNLMCRAVQELTTAFLDRDHRAQLGTRLAHEARLRGQIEAEKARTLGDLLAGFSHDLATPFSVGRDATSLLLGAIDQLRESLVKGTLDQPSLEEFLDHSGGIAAILDRNWGRAIELVDRFKRVGTEIPRGGLRRVDLRAFLADVLKTLEPLWRHRPVRVEFVGEGMVEVQTRPAAFVDILSNLVQNALVHGFPDDRAGRIEVRLGAQGDRCHLEVTDNGVGLPPHLGETIFAPYVTTREGAGGTGLGLAIVRERVQGLLAGEVTCGSTADGGARFTIDFPRILTE